MEQFLLLIDGMTGAGKTTVSDLLSERLPRTATVGMDKIKRFVSDFERGTRDNAIARSVTFVMAEKYLELGLSVIVDEPFKSGDDILPYEELAKKYGVSFHRFQLFASPEVAFQRVLNRQEKREHKVPEERIQRNISLYESKAAMGFTVIDTTATSPSEVTETISKALLD
jgi:predicted kinase